MSSRIYGFYLSADKKHVFTNSQIRPNLQTTRRLLSANKILFADPAVELDSVCRFFFCLQTEMRLNKFTDIVFANHIQKFADFFLSFTNMITAHPQTRKYPFEKTKTAFAD